MEKMSFRTLTMANEIDLVLEKIEIFSGVRLPLEYIRQSKTVGVFLQDRLVACYILVTKPNFRSLLFVPDKLKLTNKFFNRDQYEMMEVNGLWIGPALKKPSMQVKVWMHLILDIFSCKKKYVLLMHDSRNKSMGRFLDMANPEMLYAGSPLSMAGESTHKKIQVSYTTRWSIVLNIPKYLLELHRRQLRAGQFDREHAYTRALKNTDAELA